LLRLAIVDLLQRNRKQVLWWTIVLRTSGSLLRHNLLRIWRDVLRRNDVCRWCVPHYCDIDIDVDHNDDDDDGNGATHNPDSDDGGDNCYDNGTAWLLHRRFGT